MIESLLPLIILQVDYDSLMNQCQLVSKTWRTVIHKSLDHYGSIESKWHKIHLGLNQIYQNYTFHKKGQLLQLFDVALCGCTFEVYHYYNNKMQKHIHNVCVIDFLGNRYLLIQLLKDKKCPSITMKHYSFTGTILINFFRDESYLFNYQSCSIKLMQMSDMDLIKRPHNSNNMYDFSDHDSVMLHTLNKKAMKRKSWPKFNLRVKESFTLHDGFTLHELQLIDTSWMKSGFIQGLYHFDPTDSVWIIVVKSGCEGSAYLLISLNSIRLLFSHCSSNIVPVFDRSTNKIQFFAPVGDQTTRFNKRWSLVKSIDLQD